MKTILLFSVLVFSSFLLNAQEKTFVISKSRIGVINAKYEMVVNLERADTLYYVHLDFQNEKYLSIIDLKSIFFVYQADLNEFITDLQTALPEIGTKTTITWNRKVYSISLYEFIQSLCLREAQSKGSGYCYLTKAHVENLIQWLLIVNADRKLKGDVEIVF